MRLADERQKCVWCGGAIVHTRLTLPRPVTGDLVFCGWRCHERWRAAAESKRGEG